VGLAAALLAAVVLRLGSDWSTGVIGGGDAWQNLWNLDHVARALRGETGWWFTDRLWAPEGTSLRAHTLAPAVSLPAALMARLTGGCTAYNLIVWLSFPFAAITSYRLGRRLGLGIAGATIAAFVVAFNPHRMGRVLGHVNLLGIGWLPLALEGLLVACRDRSRRSLTGAVVAVASLVALVMTDWYLAVLGALTVAIWGLLEVIRRPADRARTAVVLAVCAAVSMILVAPFAVNLSRTAGEMAPGHDPRLCCTAITSLVIPSRVQMISRLTPGLVEKNTQNAAEGAAYLGIVPLAALFWLVSQGRRRPREMDFALVAGGLALVAALGPRLRVFDSLTALPLPYEILEATLPWLAVGGCVTRFEQLVFLPLALACGWALCRLVKGGRHAMLCAGAAVLLLVAEYAPADPRLHTWPFTPPDPAMRQIADSVETGAVLDFDQGSGALVRQLQHGRSQTFGYLSRRPRAPWEARRTDPVIGPLIDPGDRPPVPRPASSAWLRHRWGVRYLVVPRGHRGLDAAAAMGFESWASSDRTVVFRVPDESPSVVDRVPVGEPGVASPARGIMLSGFFQPETMGRPGHEFVGRWTSGSGSIIAPLAPGRYELDVVSTPAEPRVVTIRWARDRQTVALVRGRATLEMSLDPRDVAPSGFVEVEITSGVFDPPRDARRLGVFVVGLAAVH